MANQQDEDDYPEMKPPYLMKPGELYARATQARLEEDLYKQYERDKAIHLRKKAAAQGKNITVSLSFRSITTPVVNTSSHAYSFRSMRLGLPFNIISFCLEHHPNETIRIDALKEELAASGIKSHGLNNLRENIRNSLFGDKHELSVFIVVSSQAILVKPTAHISKEQLGKIKKASLETTAEDSE